jgi:hypothetical protein
MRLARRASLVVVMICLASTGSAFAECAWVLWLNSAADRRSLLPEKYGVERAHPTRQECVDDVHTYAALLKKEGYTIRAAGGPEAIGEKGVEFVKYFCLPDTVDPRGPKTK